MTCNARTCTSRGKVHCLRRTLLEAAAFQGATVHPDGVQIQLSVQGEEGTNSLAAGAGGEGARLEVSLGENSKVTARVYLP